MLCGVLACGGCHRFLSQFAGPAPQVKGRWVGTVQTVTVQGGTVGSYPAVALAVESGPRLPPGEGHSRPGNQAGPRLPLLVRTRNMPLMILRPTDFDLPMETKVEVRGTILRAFVGVETPEYGHRIARRPDGENEVIIMRYPPKRVDH